MRARLHLPAAAAAHRYTLDAAQSRHLIKVLRLRRGAAVEVFDGEGSAFAAAIVDDDRNAAVLETTTALPRSPADAGRVVHIGQVVCAAAKMDWAVEKMTELGAASITPLISENGKTPVNERQLQRWRRLTIAACTQCGRNKLPAILPPQAVAEWQPEGRRILLTPRAAQPLAAVAAGTEALALAIGGESGFSAQEEEILVDFGFQPAHLGARILRSETAGMAALAVLGIS